MKKHHNFYGACGRNGYVVYDSYRKYLTNGVKWLGDRQKVQGFDCLEEAFEWVKEEFMELRDDKNAILMEFVKINHITFAKEVPNLFEG